MKHYICNGKIIRLRGIYLIMKREKFVPLGEYLEFQSNIMEERSQQFLDEMKKRRSIRNFSNRSFPRKIIENCVMTASTAPNGANRQPWQFVIVSKVTVKKEIRREAEKREREFYQSILTKDWVKDLEPLGTNASKPFLENAPYLIVIFAQRYSWSKNREKQPNYYVSESVGISTGILITAIHHAGLACLTYTPPKIGFLNQILNRPTNERPFMILVVGYPSKNIMIPMISKKKIAEITQFI